MDSFHKEVSLTEIFLPSFSLGATLNIGLDKSGYQTGK